jgi:alpha-D-xyloside xylohydrolase
MEQRYSLCDFGTLANCVPSGLNATISGTPYWTTDIGGYWGSNGVDWSTAANNELFTRWLQYGAFCPVFRIHGNGAGKELYESEWSATTKANLLMIDKLHYRLMPYIYSLAWMTTNNDYTPMRHLIMDFTNDANVKNIGTSICTAPQSWLARSLPKAKRRARFICLQGTWYDFWTGASGDRRRTSITAMRRCRRYRSISGPVPSYQWVRKSSMRPKGRYH